MASPVRLICQFTDFIIADSGYNPVTFYTFIIFLSDSCNPLCNFIHLCQLCGLVGSDAGIQDLLYITVHDLI